MSKQIEFFIAKCTSELLGEWLALRQALWPHRTRKYHENQAARAMKTPARSVGYLALAGNVGVGLAEAVVRTNHVNGCSSSPVVFLEGIYVQPAWRRVGVARELCHAVEAWAADRGCQEFASDTAITNLDSQLAHQALGFQETERVVFYRKPIQNRLGAVADVVETGVA